MNQSTPQNYPSQAPSKAVCEEFYGIIRTIPAGKVASYGQIAQMGTLSQDPRDVGLALRNTAGSDVPWHRVVLASGKIAMPSRTDLRDKQRLLLQQEGVNFIDDYQVDMDAHDWQAVQIGLF